MPAILNDLTNFARMRRSLSAARWRKAVKEDLSEGGRRQRLTGPIAARR
jgi:hypothetical protein